MRSNHSTWDPRRPLYEELKAPPVPRRAAYQHGGSAECYGHSHAHPHVHPHAVAAAHVHPHTHPGLALNTYHKKHTHTHTKTHTLYACITSKLFRS